MVYEKFEPRVYNYRGAVFTQQDVDVDTTVATLEWKVSMPEGIVDVVDGNSTVFANSLAECRAIVDLSILAAKE